MLPKPSTLGILPPTDEWTSDKAEQNISEHAQSVPLEIHDGPGQKLAAKMGANNSSQHSTTGISPFMMLTSRGEQCL